MTVFVADVCHNECNVKVNASLLNTEKKPQINCTSGNLLFCYVHIIVQISRSILKREMWLQQIWEYCYSLSISIFSPCILKRCKELAIRLQKWLVDAFWCNLKPCNEDRNTRGTAVHGSSQQQWNSFSALSLYTRLCRGQCQNFAQGFYSSGLKEGFKTSLLLLSAAWRNKGRQSSKSSEKHRIMVLISFLM